MTPAGSLSEPGQSRPMGKRERMNRKLDAWLGRGFKASKLNSLLGLTVSRLAVLGKQRRARCDYARGDVAELLRQGHQERALLRAEYVIKEQNMMDAFAMVESYCHVLMERSTLLDNQRDCPDELREAIAGLLFAESRCGEVPELHGVRAIFASRLGKEFVAAAVELRNNCGVNSRMIQKLSTKQASLESRTKVTKDIAAEIGIAVHLEEEPSPELMGPKQPPSPTPRQPAAAGADGVSGLMWEEYLSDSMKLRPQRYMDAASAAQAAFESAAYAAAAARAAVELSRSESQGKAGPGDQSGPAGTMSSGRSQPVEAHSSESECEEEVGQSIKPVQHPEKERYGSPAGSQRDEPIPVRDKRMSDDAAKTSEEEEELEGAEVGSGKFMGDPPGPKKRRAPPASASEPRCGDGLREHHRAFGVSSDDDASDEDVEELKPQMAAFQRQSRERQQRSWERSQHQEVNIAEYRYGKEEEEAGPATHDSERSRVRNPTMDVADRVPMNRFGMVTGPVSVRTRRSGF